MKRISKIILTALCAAVALTALSACGNNAAESTVDPADITCTKAVMTVEGYDPITIEFAAEDAPTTVANFIKLSQEGFYDGLTFHRLIEGFCLQGGDPKGNGTGSSDESIVGEFSENGIDNALADNYCAGVVAMARTNDPNSASCQFFITLDSSESVAAALNGKYAAFGTISSEDMETVAKIVADYAPFVTDNNGSLDKADQPVITSIVAE